MPIFPSPNLKGEARRKPVWWWQNEGDFRVLRDRLWEDHDRPTHRLHNISLEGADGQKIHLGRDRAARLDYIARRRLYLSVGYYTGMHTRDLDLLNDESLIPDMGNFNRRNTKSADCIPDVMLKMPEQLHLDVIEEINRLGRFWHRDEKIAGGRWETVSDVCTSEGRRLNLPLPISPRVWRRSVARNLTLLRWSEAEIAEYLGHVDRTMIATVYRRIPLDQKTGERLPWTNASMRAVQGAVARTAVVFDFQKARPGTTPAPASPLQSAEDEAGAGPRKPR